MMDDFIPFLWGQIRYGSIQPSSNDPQVSSLTIDGKSVWVRNDDPGLKELSLYRLKDKKVLVIFLKMPSGTNLIWAIYKTNDARKVMYITRVMGGTKASEEELSAKRPLYLGI